MTIITGLKEYAPDTTTVRTPAVRGLTSNVPSTTPNQTDPETNTATDL